MLTAILATAALAATPAHSITTCTLDSHGNANKCEQSSYRGDVLAEQLAGRTTVTWDRHKAFLYRPRVNGRRGQWNFDHTLLRWRKLSVTFDGISFVNYAHSTVTINARSENWQ